MIRVISFAVCIVSFAWLALGSLQFRQSIRSSVRDAYSLIHRVDPEHAADNGKLLNSYYEDVYRNLPSTIIPAGMLMGGATALLIIGKRRRAEPARATKPGSALSVQ